MHKVPDQRPEFSHFCGVNVRFTADTEVRKTVVVFKKSLYNRVVAFATALLYYKEMVTIQHHLDEAEPLQETGNFNGKFI